MGRVIAACLVVIASVIFSPAGCSSPVPAVKIGNKCIWGSTDTQTAGGQCGCPADCTSGICGLPAGVVSGPATTCCASPHPQGPGSACWCDSDCTTGACFASQCSNLKSTNDGGGGDGDAPRNSCPSGTVPIATGKTAVACSQSKPDGASSGCPSSTDKCMGTMCNPEGRFLCPVGVVGWTCPSGTTACSDVNDHQCCGPSKGGASDAGPSVCEMSTTSGLCSCGTSETIDKCSISPSLGTPKSSCAGLDCCAAGGKDGCCECASSDYLITLGFTCASWIQSQKGKSVSSCP